MRNFQRFEAARQSVTETSHRTIGPLRRPDEGGRALAATDIGGDATAFDHTIVGTANPETLIGTTGSDLIQGLGGADEIYGQAGADQLEGGDGDDQIFADTDTPNDPDSVFGGNGSDWMGLGLGDSADGGAGVDGVQLNLYATSLALTIDMNACAAGVAQSLASGGSIVNIEHLAIFGGTGNDVVLGHIGYSSSLRGGEGNDHLTAGDVNDDLYGGNGSDVLNGGAHNDVLDGGNGNDKLIGEDGNDTMTGGAGTDQFRITGQAFGADTITDFQNGVDKIRVTGVAAWNDFSDVAVSTNGSGWAVVTFSDGSSITLTGMLASDVDASDFLWI